MIFKKQTKNNAFQSKPPTMPLYTLYTVEGKLYTVHPIISPNFASALYQSIVYEQILCENINFFIQLELST